MTTATASANGTAPFPKTPCDAAKLYLSKGRAPIPLPPRSKKAVLKDWPNLRLTPANLEVNFPTGGENVGLLLGEPSGGLIDVDLDAPEAVAVAPFLLPATPLESGRAGKPRSHFWFVVDDPPAKATEEHKDLDGTMLIELRSTGAQTVVPPSRHEDTGELIVWHEFGEPAHVVAENLLQAVREVAAAALLSRHWPERGSRDEAAMALAGGLIRAGWDEEKVSRFLVAVAKAAGDEEAHARAGKAARASLKLKNDKNITGWPTLSRKLGQAGEAVVRRVRGWLLMDSGDCGNNEPQPWPDAIPLGEVPDVPPFPVAVLPGPMRRLVEETAWAMNCPLDFAAVPLLALAGGALGNARHLAITRTHTQPPLLYAVIVSLPGTTKSPVLKLLRRPFDDVQGRYLEEWRAQLDAWEQAEPDERGPRPVLKRCIVSDVTTESLGIVLCENPRGLVMVRDELAGLVAGMNQYKGGKGHDRQVYLALWAGDAILIDRKSDRALKGAPLYVTDPFTGIVGSVQPAVLDRLRGEPVRGMPPPDDGFLDRFLFAYPEGLRAIGEEWREVSEEALNAWREAIERLLGLSMVASEEGRPRPFYVHLTSSGKQAWQRFTHAHAEEVNAADFPPHLAGPWAKLKGYGARLALIVHYLRWVCGEATGEDVDGESMDRATALVAYFKAHARKVHAVMDADPRIADARKVFRWIVTNRRQRFQKRDAYQALKGTFKMADDLDPVMTVLEKHALIRQAPPTDRTGPGRKPSPFYEVHPRLPEVAPHNSHNSQNSLCGAGSGTPYPNSGDCGNCGEQVGDDGPAPEAEDDPDADSAPEPRPSAPPYLLVKDQSGLQTVIQALEETALVGLDLETTGLDPRADHVRLLSLALNTTDGGTFNYLVDCFAVDPAALFPALAEKELIIHNGAFDLAFMARRGFTPAGKVHDTMLLARLLTAGTNERNDLAACCSRWLNRSLNKEQQTSDWTGALSANQLAYAVADVEVLAPLLKVLTTKIKDASLANVEKIEARALPAFVWLAGNGVPFDRAGWDALTAEASSRAKQLIVQLDAVAPSRPGFLAVAGAWDWNSPLQIKEAFAAAGFAVDSTADDELAKIDHPMATLLRDYRAARKLETTYGNEWAAHVSTDGRIYASWNQLGTVAGRISCSEPNLQQIPRDVRYRRCFKAPPGRVLVKADYSQLQLRIAAKISGDEATLDAYARGEDLHTLTARKLTGQAEVSNADRHLAKAVNFGLLFGAGAKRLMVYAKTSYGIDLTEEEARHYRRAFFNAYPGLERWQKRAGNSTAKECRTLAGRRRLLDDKTPFTFRLNSPVQGTEADGAKLALALLWERREQVPGAFPVLFVHDEIVVECDEDKAEAVANWLKTAMTEAMAPLIAPVPAEVEVKVARTWSG
jgi:DNA polymerase-1